MVKKAVLIRKLLKERPELSYKEIAETVGTTWKYVARVAYLMRQKTEKRKVLIQRICCYDIGRKVAYYGDACAILTHDEEFNAIEEFEKKCKELELEGWSIEECTVHHCRPSFPDKLCIQCSSYVPH